MIELLIDKMQADISDLLVEVVHTIYSCLILFCLIYNLKILYNVTYSVHSHMGFHFFTKFLFSVILNFRPYFNGAGYRHRFTLRGSRTSEGSIAF